MVIQTLITYVNYFCQGRFTQIFILDIFPPLQPPFIIPPSIHVGQDLLVTSDWLCLPRSHTTVLTVISRGRAAKSKKS